MRILGISALVTIAALLDDEVIGGCTKRFTRKKRELILPEHAIEYCLKEAGVTIADIDYITFWKSLFLNLNDLLKLI